MPTHPNTPSREIPPTNERAEKAERLLEAALLEYKKTLNPNAPRLLTGRPQVAVNSLTHGLSGQSVFLTPTELLAYLNMGRDLIDDLAPVTAAEIIHAQRIVDTEWRLNVVGNLSTICHTSAVLFESDALYAANPHLADLPPDSVSAQILHAHAQAGAVRRQCEGPNIMDKLGRQETRLFRSLRAMRQDYAQMQSKMQSKLPNKQPSPASPERPTWNPEESKCYQWYRNLAELATALIAARAEVAEKTVITPAPSETSDTENLLCKNVLQIVRPLSPETRETLTQAHAASILTDLEQTLFDLPKAA